MAGYGGVKFALWLESWFHDLSPAQPWNLWKVFLMCKHLPVDHADNCQQHTHSTTHNKSSAHPDFFYALSHQPPSSPTFIFKWYHRASKEPQGSAGNYTNPVAAYPASPMSAAATPSATNWRTCSRYQPVGHLEWLIPWGFGVWKQSFGKSQSSVALAFHVHFCGFLWCFWRTFPLHHHLLRLPRSPRSRQQEHRHSEPQIWQFHNIS